jgi:uncharacterized RDD family membrane protein YckC
MTDESQARTPPQATDFPETGVNSLASLGQRAGGWLIDLVITTVPATAASVPFLDVDAISDANSLPVWLVGLVVGVWVIYQTATIAIWGKTLGALFVGVRIARYTDGNRPSFEQSAMRALLPAMFPAIRVPILNAGWVIVYMAALYNPLRRGFHDVAGGTVVIRTR